MVDARESWLNGWRRTGTGVIIGTMMHCAGCGKDIGLICLAITGDEVWPEKEPDWPFNADDCPVCVALNWEKTSRLPEVSVDELAEFPASKLRQALIKIKTKKVQQ